MYSIMFMKYLEYLQTTLKYYCNVRYVQYCSNYKCRYEGFLKWGYLQIIHIFRIFHYKQTILGIPHLQKPPNADKWFINHKYRYIYQEPIVIGVIETNLANILGAPPSRYVQ